MSILQLNKDYKGRTIFCDVRRLRSYGSGKKFRCQPAEIYRRLEYTKRCPMTTLSIYVESTGSDYTLMLADGRMSDMPAGYPPLATLEEAEAKADAVRAMLDEQSQRKKPSKTKSREYAA